MVHKRASAHMMAMKIGWRTDTRHPMQRKYKGGVIFGLNMMPMSSGRRIVDEMRGCLRDQRGKGSCLEINLSRVS